ncbi:hypothetical protein Tco_1167617, partial [Tanacetum coccineum]
SGRKTVTFSIEPDEFKDLLQDSVKVELIRGDDVPNGFVFGSALTTPFLRPSIDQHQGLAFHYASPVTGFSSSVGGFSGYQLPAQIQGDDEEHDGVSDKPSSGSSDAHH